LQNVADGDRVVVVTTDEGDHVVVGAITDPTP
jgi:hypothetical protein